MVKKSSVDEYQLLKDSFQAIKLKDVDEVISIEIFDEKKEMLFATRDGMGLRCPSDDVPLQGRVSMGVKGINLNSDDYVISANQIRNSGEIFVMSNIGMSKRILLANIPVTARYRKGVKLIDFKNKLVETLLFAGYVQEPIDIALIGDTNDISIINSESLSIEKRETKGKSLQGLKFFEKLIMVVPLEK